MDTSDLGKIARLNPITQTQSLLDAIAWAWSKAPGVLQTDLLLVYGATRIDIRRHIAGAYKVMRVLRKYTVRKKKTLKAADYCLTNTDGRGLIVWPNSVLKNPIMPGGFSVITPQSDAVKNGLVEDKFKKCRGIIPLTRWAAYQVNSNKGQTRTGQLGSTYQPQTNPVPQYGFAHVNLVLENEDAVIPFCNWMCEYGFSLSKVCGERVFRLSSHPHNAFWFDPELLIDEFDDREHLYLKQLVKNGDLPIRTWAKEMAWDFRTVSATKARLTEKYDDHHLRLACRAGYMGAKNESSSLPTL